MNQQENKAAAWNSADWALTFNAEGPGTAELSLNDKPLLRLRGAVLGELEELAGLPRYCRSHAETKFGWNWVEQETVLPFGAEPTVRRQLERVANHVRVVTDLTLPRAMDLEMIEVDRLVLPGPWRSLRVLPCPAPGETPDAFLSVELPAPGREQAIECRPLALLLERPDGDLLEIGAGWDLWRWERQTLPEELSAMVLENRDGDLSLKRVVRRFDEALAVGAPPANARFTWHFAWLGKNAPAPAAIPDRRPVPLFLDIAKWPAAAPDTTYRLESDRCPDEAKVQTASGPVPALCLLSRQVANLSKTWIRRSVATLRDKEAFLTVPAPRPCLNASHTGRPGKTAALHWDYPRLLEFYAWANKKLWDSGARLRVAHADSSAAIAELPSAIGLRVREFATPTGPEEEP